MLETLGERLAHFDLLRLLGWVIGLEPSPVLKLEKFGFSHELRFLFFGGLKSQIWGFPGLDHSRHMRIEVAVAVLVTIHKL